MSDQGQSGGQAGGPADAEQLTPRKWGALAAAVLCILMTLANSQASEVAHSDIAGGLGAGQNLGSWISTAYWFGDLLIIPFTLPLARVFSQRWWLVVNIAGYGAFCLLSGLVRDIVPFLALRFLQGLTGGALSPLALAIALSLFTGRNRPLGLLAYGLVATASLPVIPLLAGVGVVWLGWGAVFAAIMVPGLAAIALAVWSVPPQPIDFGNFRAQDWMGALIWGLSMAGLAGAMDQSVRLWFFDPGLIWAFVCAGGLLLALFLAHNLTAAAPLVNLKVVRRRELSVGLSLNALSRLAPAAYTFAIPTFLATVRGLRPEQFGRALLLVAAPQVLTAPLLFYLGKRFDERWLLSFALVILSASCFIAARVAPDWGPQEFAPAFLLQGLGQSFLIFPVLIVVVSRATQEDTQSYNIMFNSVRDFGTVFATFVISWTSLLRGNFHADRIAEFSSATRPFFAERVAQIVRALGPDRAAAYLRQTLQGQTATLVAADVLRVIGVFMALGLVLTWLLPKPPPPMTPLATVELGPRGPRLVTPDEKPPPEPPPDPARS